jgi:hypothetical protein
VKSGKLSFRHPHVAHGRTTGRWTVGSPSDIVLLQDLRGGFAAYEIYNDKIVLLRLRDGREASIAIPRSSDYDFWAIDAASFGGGGLYYQYTEELKTPTLVTFRSIIRFIPQSQLDGLFNGANPPEGT